MKITSLLKSKIKFKKQKTDYFKYFSKKEK